MMQTGNVTRRVEQFKPLLSSGTSSAFTPIKLKPTGLASNKQEFRVDGFNKRYLPVVASASESAISTPHKALRSAQLKDIQKNWDNEKQLRNTAQIQSPFDESKKAEQQEVSQETSRYGAQSVRVSSEPDGMIGLRRLLRKENTPAPVVVPKNEDKFGVKKSSSGVISNSYWSRISASQPSFLRKFFEKKSPSSSTPQPVSEPDKAVEPEVEAFVALNVAEKASHFMKLEHDQRFSKWRNNSNNKKEERSKSSRYSTQPVTTLEVQIAAKAKVRTDTPNVSVNECLNASVKKAGHIEVSVASAQLQPRTKSSSAEFDDGSSQTQLEPSSLSLKDRVHMFNRLSRVSINSPPPTPLISSSAPNQTRESRNGKPDILLRRHPSKSEIESSYEDLTLVSPLAQKYDLRNSPRKSSSSPIPFLRNARVQSMYAQAMDPSEDETSSGGQEVAEIISRSYENSPIVRKKSWRSLKSTPAALSRDVKGGKWEDNISHWSTATDFSMRMTDGKENSSFPKVPIPVVRSLPTTTSNLLPILTALSSSDDQLSESKPFLSNAQKLQKLNRRSSGEVRVPNPDDESFRTFFRNEQTSPVNGECPAGVLLENSTDDLNLGWVERDEDLLVNMKRQLPRRKSNRGKSRNPLKVLAARIDFKNQKYTETLQ